MGVGAAQAAQASDPLSAGSSALQDVTGQLYSGLCSPEWDTPHPRPDFLWLDNLLASLLPHAGPPSPESWQGQPPGAT